MSDCFHGGAFWSRIGPSFDSLTKAHEVVNADVLDAWFPPAPSVIDSLSECLEWIARTSPPTHAEGLEQEIASRLTIDEGSVLAGPGSSSLIFSAFRLWLTPSSKVLLIEPSYGEYAHVAGLAGSRVDTLVLSSASGFRADLDALVAMVKACDYDLIAIVNPNNPTGDVIGVESLERICESAPETTRIWIDEAYLDYTNEESMSGFAAKSPNVFVCKSLSKSLALSGLRAAYLVGPEKEISRLRRWSPPWSVSLPAQIAATKALQDPGYYAKRYRETLSLRAELAAALRELDLCVTEGAGNWVLCRLGVGMSSASQVVKSCESRGIYLRDAGRTAPSLRDRYIRIAVKERADQVRIVAALSSTLFRDRASASGFGNLK